MSKMLGSFAALMCVSGFLQAQTVLTYNGGGGDWFASNVWLNESGESVNWQDGSIAVITNKAVNLTTNAFVYGLRPHLTQFCSFGGSGKMTVGAGGIYKTGSGEMNIQFMGGLHLSASQSWTAPNGGLVCLDGLRPFTAADGVELTGRGSAELRMNAAGALTSSNTIYVTESSFLSLSKFGSLGASTVILDGTGTRMKADAGFVISNPRLCGRLILRNGAAISCSGVCTNDLDAFEVDAPAVQLVSSVTGTGGAQLILSKTNTTFAVTNGAALQVALPLADGQNVAAAVRKTGTGVLTLSVANLFSGGLSVGEGLVRITASRGAGLGAISVASPSVLEFAAADTLTNAISGSGRIVKTGADTLTMTGANSYTGGTSLSGGVTRVASAGSLGTGTATLTNGATLVFTSSQTVSASDVARIVGTGTVLAGSGAEVVWDGNYAVGSSFVYDAEALGTLAVGQLTGSNLIKNAAGKLRIAGTAGYSGEIVVNAGVLEIGSTANLATNVTVRTAGNGIVQLDSLDGLDLTKIKGTQAIALKNGAAVALNTDTLTVMPTTVSNETWSISSLTGAADLVKTGSGTLVVSNATAFTGRVRVLEGTLLASSAMGGNTVTVSNGVFSAYGVGVTLQNSFTVAGGVLQADNGGSLGSGAISLLSAGTLMATNAGSLGSGTLAVSAGKLRMNAGGTAGTRAITLSSSGRIEVYDGAGFDNATVTIGGGTLDFRATTTMGRGVTMTASTRFEANTPSGAATPTVATLAGAITTTAWGKLVVAGNGQLRFAGGGTFIATGEIFVQSNGDLTIVSNKVTVTGYVGLESGGKRLAIADGGTLEMTGSSVNLHAGYGAGSFLVEVMTGGVFIAKSNIKVLVGMNGANATFRLSGGEAVLEGSSSFEVGNSLASSVGCIELNAGVLRTSRQLTKGLGAGSVVFNGGLWQTDAVANPNPWIVTTIPVTVAASGGSVDMRGLTAQLGTAGISGPGCLTLTGGGSLSFSSVSTNWTGGLTLERGTAVALATNALGKGIVTLGTNTLRLGANALLSNTVNAPAIGGIVSVEAGTTGTVATLSGGKLMKQGGGELVADYVITNTDLAIQGGSVKVMPVAEISHSPASLPAIWVDASVAASLITATSNDVSRWYDCRTPGDTNGFFATNLFNRPLLVTNALNGLPVLDFGNLGQTAQINDNRMMVFKNYQTNIRSVFWVIGSRNGGGFLLGDSQLVSGGRHFHRNRGGGSLYGGVPGDPLWAGGSEERGIVRGGETRTNSVAVNGTTAGLSGGFDLVSWRISVSDDAANNTAGAVWFASCSADPTGRLNGGQELAEVLIYTNRLTEAERFATEVYLTRKWFPTRTLAGLEIGKVSLEGTGTGFVNAYHAPVRVAELVINAADVYMAGVAGGTTVNLLTVAAAGVLDASRLTPLAVGGLELQELATLAVAFDSAGVTPVLSVAGGMVLPAGARFTVLLTGTVRPPSRALLIDAEGAVQTPVGQTVWTHVGEVSHASQVIVDAVAREVWLSTPRGSVLFLK